MSDGPVDNTPINAKKLAEIRAALHGVRGEAVSKRSRQARRLQRRHERTLYFLAELRAAARRYILAQRETAADVANACGISRATSERVK